MRFRSIQASLIAVSTGALLFPAILVRDVDAQKQGKVLWYPVATVNRVNKPDRPVTRPRPKTQKAALLTLQWRLFKRGNGNLQEEADPAQVFHNEDQLKLAVTINQNGYLYVIHQMNNGDGRLVFPDPRSNDGRNEVQKDKEYVVPSYCPAFPDPNDCWWEMAPPTGRENFIVVFSRDEFEKLPRRVALSNGDYEYPTIRQDLLAELINSSRQEKKEVTGRLTIPGKPVARFATRLQNTNVKDNEELIGRIQLKHGD
jgi:hypothetical protein